MTGDHYLERAEVRFDDQWSRSRAGGVALTARLGSQVSAGFAFAAHAAEVGATHGSAVTATPRLAARRLLPMGIRLGANASVAYERRRSRGPSSADIPVVDEPLVVPPTRSAALGRPGIDAGSMVVRRTDGGLEYLAGTDYRVVVTGVSVRIEVPPGSRIQVGETVLVSYRYREMVASAAGTHRLEYDFALSRGGVEVRHRRSLRSRSTAAGADVAGAAGVLPGYDETRTEASLRSGTPLGDLVLDGALRRWSRRGAGTNDVVAGGSLALPTLGHLGASVAVNWSASRSGPMLVRALTASTSMAWTVSPAVVTRATLESFRWRQTAVAPQRYLSAVLRADWHAGLTDAGLRVELHRREYLHTNLETRLAAELVRRF